MFMICQKCSQKNLDHAVFCQECGAKLEQSKADSTGSEKKSKPAKVSYKTYSGSGACDVCNKSVGPNEAYLVPVNIFYGSEKYKKWLSNSPMAELISSMGVNVETYIAQMKAMDKTSHSAVCSKCVQLFE